MAEAQQGKTYAQVLDGKCHWLFTALDLPEWNENDITVMDVTGQDVEVGDLWDGDSFSKPAPVVPAIPEVVTMRQARLALLQAGLLAQVNTAVANMPGAAGDTARIEWEFSSTVERNRPLVQSLIGALGLTESQLDDLFRLAATL